MDTHLCIQKYAALDGYLGDNLSRPGCEPQADAYRLESGPLKT